MKIKSLVVLVIAGLWFAQPAAQNQERYKARLATVPMDGGMRATVAGSGAVSAVLAGTRLTVNGTFQGLLSPASTARVHHGPAMGVRGAPLADLTVSKGVNGMLTGSI